MILRKMDRSTMLKCRLINSYWKAVVDSLQEKRILSSWLTWNATDAFDKDIFRIMPTLEVFNGYGAKIPDYLNCHSALKEEAFKNGYNPFPNKSLCIYPYDDSHIFDAPAPREWYFEMRDLIGREGIEMYLFLIDHGHHLTSLALHKIRVKPAQLHQILNHLPNLKALTLFDIWFRDHIDQFFNENPLEDGLPMLTHLRVQTSGPAWIQWLVDCCAANLVRLELDIQEITTRINRETDWALEKLEKLTIRDYNGNSLQNKAALPHLKCLSINFKKKHEENKDVSILNFVKQFSTTLEVLNLGPDIRLKELGKRDEWEGDESMFHKVTNLSMQVPWLADNDVDVLRLHIFLKFPNLEYLELQRFSHDLNEGNTEEAIRARAVKHIEELKYFQFCPKLKTVSVTNVGQVWNEEYHISVDKETFKRMAAEMRELSDDNSSDSDSSVESSSSSFDSD